MKVPLIVLILFYAFIGLSQSNYELAKEFLNSNQLDSARFYINKSLNLKPTTEDYFLSGVIHEAVGKDLRALADYEAVAKGNPKNLEAFFQKGVIYYNSASSDEAIKAFTYVIENYRSSNTNAVYFANDPLGSKGTFLTSLQSMLGRVYQYRGLAYNKLGNREKALADFNKSFDFDTLAEYYINRSQFYVSLDQQELARHDLRNAIELEPENYLAWYNLVLIDESIVLPPELIRMEAFSPMLNLIGANAYERGDYRLSNTYFSKAIENDPNDNLAIINRGKALLKIGKYQLARVDFLRALRLDERNLDAVYLIGNSFFYEKNYDDAIAFYERYLSVDRGYANVWYNTAVAYLNTGQTDHACSCLERADQLGMKRASEMKAKQCGE